MMNASEKAVIVFTTAVIAAKSSNCVLRILSIDHSLEFLKDSNYIFCSLRPKEVNPSASAKIVDVENKVAVGGMRECKRTTEIGMDKVKWLSSLFDWFSVV